MINVLFILKMFFSLTLVLKREFSIILFAADIVFWNTGESEHTCLQNIT